MKVTVKCFSTLVKPHVCDYKDSTEHELPAGGTVKDLITKLGLNMEEIKIIFVNSKEVDVDTVLKDGDVVGMSPASGGM
ncbi:MAG: MoaD/ThiS family protein [Geobacteraceae bacterium]|nr:MoaD/ThiS family protein [Geobacteraceae bacterium]